MCCCCVLFAFFLFFLCVAASSCAGTVGRVPCPATHIHSQLPALRLSDGWEPLSFPCGKLVRLRFLDIRIDLIASGPVLSTHQNPSKLVLRHHGQRCQRIAHERVRRCRISTGRGKRREQAKCRVVATGRKRSQLGIRCGRCFV